MENFQTFKNSWLGRRVDYDHVFLYQCVDLVLQGLHDMHNLSGGVRGNAIDYWNNPSPALLNIASRVGSSQAIEGDIVVINGLPGNPYGHVGWATGNIDGTNVEILEQNGQNGNGDGLGGNAIRTRYIPRSRVAGLLRFHDQPAPAPAQTAAAVTVSGGKKLFLPTAGGYWRVYPVGGPWTVGHEVGKLWPGNPAWAPGLTYDILAQLAPNVVKINTETYGEVGIYVGADTPAQFVDAAPAPAPVAPPAPAPSVPVVPAPTPEPAKPANTAYTKLSNPQSLLVNRTTHKWDLGFVNDAHATSVADLPQGTPFTAYGLAQRTDGDKPAYFMSQEDFGNADQTGIPANNVGVNTVDLSPAPSPQPAASEQPPILTPPPMPQAEEANSIQVTVKPPDWHKSFTSFLTPQKFLANADVVVHEVDETIVATNDHPVSQQLIKGQTVTIAGTFTREGIKYYRTAMSVTKGYWYGIPVISLTRLSDAQEEDELDKMFSEVGDEVKKVSNAVKTGNVEGFVNRIFHKK